MINVIVVHPDGTSSSTQLQTTQEAARRWIQNKIPLGNLPVDGWDKPVVFGLFYDTETKQSIVVEVE
jgi:hypothetical protein